MYIWKKISIIWKEDLLEESVDLLLDKALKKHSLSHKMFSIEKLREVKWQTLRCCF